jgi:hypothetical protein
MHNHIKRLLSLFAAAVLLLSIPGAALASPADQPMVPLRAFFEERNIEVEWYGPARQIHLRHDGREVTLSVSSQLVLTDGVPVSLLNSAVVIRSDNLSYIAPEDAQRVMGVLADAPGTIAYRHLLFIEENLPHRVPFTRNEYDTADWIVRELLRMGHSPDAITVQEFPMNPTMLYILSELHDQEGALAEEMPASIAPLMGAFVIHDMDEVLALEFVEVSRNVVLTVPGVSEKTIVVGAHYDGVHNAGISDNASGVALLLESAERLLEREHYYTVTYVFFGAEEVGLVGALHYVETLTEEEAGRIVLMVNADVIFDGTILAYGAGYHDFASGSEGSSAASRLLEELADTLNGEHGFELVKEPGAVYVTSDQLAFLFAGYDVLVFWSVDDFLLCPVRAGMAMGMIPDLSPERLALMLEMLDGNDHPEVTAAIESDRVILEFFLTDLAFTPEDMTEVLYEMYAMLEMAMVISDDEDEIMLMYGQFLFIDAVLAVLEHPGLEDVRLAILTEMQESAGTGMGLVMHTVNDNLAYFVQYWPGLIERALEAYSVFLDAVLRLPAGSLCG